MTITTTQTIPAEKANQFHTILVATNGRYVSNPYSVHGGIRVHYQHEGVTDHNLFSRLWTQCTTPIKETYKNQMWRRWLRRIGITRW
jgi:hypothetical protein